jgi:hypothetical protein
MIGLHELQEGLARSMNDQNFTFVDEGLVEVETFISDYLNVYGYRIHTFKMEEIRGVRRCLKITCLNPLGASGYFEFTVFDSIY